MARLFFALWPPEPGRAALEALGESLAKRCGGRAVPLAKLHLTLAFLGEVDPGRIEEATRVAADAAVPAFEIRFDRVGSFRKPGVAWAGMAEMPAALAELAAGLAAGLRSAGFTLDRRAFAPHLTLVRRIERTLAEEPATPIAWTVESFALVESDLRRARYVEKGRWGSGETR